MNSLRRCAAPVLLAVVAFTVYLANVRPMGAFDSIPTRLLPFSLLREGDVHLDEFSWLYRSGRPYFLVQNEAGHWVSKYPIFTAVVTAPLALPFVAWLEGREVEDDEVRFRVATLIFDRIGAAFLAACSVALLLAALRKVVPAAIAVAIAVVYAFGTSTWSVSSQALWQHAGSELALAGLSLCLLSADTRRAAIAAGAFAAAAAATRPTMAIFSLLALVYVWRERRHRLAAFLPIPVAIAILLFLYNTLVVGRARGGYYGTYLLGAPTLEAFLGLLVSPNRGLFVFTPVAALALPELRRRQGRDRAWLFYLSIGIGLYLILFSAWRTWWAGFAYGPRFLADVLPAFALLAAPTVARLAAARAGRIALAVATVWSVGVQAIGVYCDTGTWNRYPMSVDLEPARLWSVRDLQIARALNEGWHGTDFVPLIRQSYSSAPAGHLRLLGPRDLNGTVEVRGDAPTRVRTDSRINLLVEVANRSKTVWPAFSDFGFLNVGVEYRWLVPAATSPSVERQYRVMNVLPVPAETVLPFPRNLAPGETVLLPVELAVPDRHGDLELELRVVQQVGLQRFESGDASTVLRVSVDTTGGPR